MCGPKHYAWWASPAGQMTLWALLAFNICGFVGWIAGAIYVTAVGSYNMCWMWAMPWQHVFQVWGIYRGMQRCKNTTIGMA